jgi:hypothetical protein
MDTEQARTFLAIAAHGSCFLPARMAAHYIVSGLLFQVEGSPEFVHPAYMVYARIGQYGDGTGAVTYCAIGCDHPGSFQWSADTDTVAHTCGVKH